MNPSRAAATGGRAKTILTLLSDWVPSSEALEIDAQRRPLMRFLSRHVRDESVREDLVQESLVRLLVFSRRQTIENFAAAARFIAWNVMRDHFRRHRRTSAEPLDQDYSGDAPLPDQVLLHKQRLQRFIELLDQMPPLRREVFIRRRLHGQSHAEIAQALDLTQDAVEKHIVRGMRQLGEAIDLK